MHPYSTDESRVQVYGLLAVAAVVASWLIVAVTSRFTWPQWLVSAPSLAATFTVAYRVFEVWIWRWAPLRGLGLVEVADVSGVYEGKLISTYRGPDGSNVERAVRFEITQTWTRLNVTMSVLTGESSSYSVSAVASMGNDGRVALLKYLYQNKVSPAIADADMADHEGAADLRIDASGRLYGRYFNSRPRSGSIEAQKVDS